MRLSSSHDLSYEFGGLIRANLSHEFRWLTQVDSNCFLYPIYSYFFLILSFNTKVYWKLNFIIYFNLLSIRLSQSHNLGCGFDRLTRVDLSHFIWYFLIYIFFNFIFQHWIYWELYFIICFDLFFITWHGFMTQHADWQSELTWIHSICCYLNIYKKYHLNYLF
jgi:hypothetical protein